MTAKNEIMSTRGFPPDWWSAMSEHPEDENPSHEDGPSREELLDYISEFMKEGRHAERMYRDNFCELVVNKVFQDFGYEGLCNLMIKIDGKANWISDILIENSDFDDIMFKKYGIYDPDVCEKARTTEAIMEMNSKIWRLRKKYATVIVDEIMARGTGRK